jgi:hypothetical protein
MLKYTFQKTVDPNRRLCAILRWACFRRCNDKLNSLCSLAVVSQHERTQTNENLGVSFVMYSGIMNDCLSIKLFLAYFP